MSCFVQPTAQRYSFYDYLNIGDAETGKYLTFLTWLAKMINDDEVLSVNESANSFSCSYNSEYYYRFMATK